MLDFEAINPSGRIIQILKLYSFYRENNKQYIHKHHQNKNKARSAHTKHVKTPLNHLTTKQN
jgi:hypothetical protein